MRLGLLSTRVPSISRLPTRHRLPEKVSRSVPTTAILCQGIKKYYGLALVQNNLAIAKTLGGRSLSIRFDSDPSPTTPYRSPPTSAEQLAKRGDGVISSIHCILGRSIGEKRLCECTLGEHPSVSLDTVSAWVDCMRS